ncbi:sensor histidine kinase [Euzebyella saccharophila]|uniref:histidine kinase n=1 Tax=Euzebyella saccharophila TaxID=679664 RepID=A0ABV8JXB7_9FLAO|nr:PAS domain-containing sensor histidine kinase [Euzebyella saccharophila]
MVPNTIVTEYEHQLVRDPRKMTSQEMAKCQRGDFFDIAHTPFLILDDNLVVKDINQIGLILLQAKREDVVGKNTFSAFPTRHKEVRESAYRKVLKTGIPINIDGLKIKTKTKTYTVTLRVFRLEEGLGIAAQDTTELFKTIEDLRKTENALKKANKNITIRNEELEEFSYVAAHDLKAPMTNFGALLHLLKEDDKLNLEGHPIFQKLEEVSGLMNRRLNALNQVISLKSNLGKQPEELCFYKTLEEIKSELSISISRSNCLILFDFEKCPTIYIDRLQLHSILQNMIMNAIKYRHPDRNPIIKITTKIKKGKVLLTVKDNGIGFKDDFGTDKVFGLFKRMHTHVEGQGVGLYIVKSIAQSRGGKVKVKTELNKGTEFKIYL